ncbi:MAG: hypothetical protein ACUVV0_08705 [Anaerolineae bacterium]
MQILLTFLYRSLFILAAHYLLRGELERLLEPLNSNQLSALSFQRPQKADR